MICVSENLPFMIHHMETPFWTLVDLLFYFPVSLYWYIFIYSHLRALPYYCWVAHESAVFVIDFSVHEYSLCMHVRQHIRVGLVAMETTLTSQYFPL